uniref:Uncharacterized protein n=1 Tax=viral metagenome TaxID=1070528 RepID=A0A6C0JFG1_9ZZZZ
MMNISNKTIYAYQELAFDFFITLSYILIILYVFGISYEAKRHLDIIDKYVKIYICLFLIYRFNPFKKNYECSNLDRKIVFSAALFMFTTTFFGFVFF